MDTFSDVFNGGEMEIFHNDSDTTTGCKQSPPCPLVFTSDSETSTEEEEISKPDSCDDETIDMVQNF
jgi:hypothetical protein